MRIVMLILPLLLISCEGWSFLNNGSGNDEPQEEELKYPDDYISFSINDKEITQHADAAIGPNRCKRVAIRYRNLDEETLYIEHFFMGILFDEKDTYSLNYEYIDDFDDERIVHNEYCNNGFHIGARLGESDWDVSVGTYLPEEDTGDANELTVTEYDPEAGEHGRMKGEFETTLYYKDGTESYRRYPDTLNVEGSFDVHLQCGFNKGNGKC